LWDNPDLAQKIARNVYFKHVAYLTAQVNAQALKDTDKLIFTPEGVMPNLVFSDSEVLPTVSVP
jgi:hypothetical protein